MITKILISEGAVKALRNVNTNDLIRWAMYPYTASDGPENLVYDRVVDTLSIYCKGEKASEVSYPVRIDRHLIHETESGFPEVVEVRHG